MRTLRSAAVLAAVMLTASPAHATCLSIDLAFGVTGAWVNNCSVGITVRWRSTTGHKGLKWVAPHSKASAYLKNTGRVRWMECESTKPYQRAPTRVRGGQCR